MKDAQFISKMGANGRIVIPEKICYQMGAEEGTRFELCYDEQKAEITLCKYNPYKEILVYLKNAITDIELLYGETRIVNEEESDRIIDTIDELQDIFMRMKAIILK